MRAKHVCALMALLLLVSFGGSLEAGATPRTSDCGLTPTLDCGPYRQVCGYDDNSWCCDLGTSERRICCDDSNGGCKYCSESGDRRPY
jgi:hypothetical protein